MFLKIKIMKLQGILVLNIAVLVFLNLMTGCSYYYQVQTSNRMTAEELTAFNNSNKYFILHLSDTAWHLYNVTVNDNSFTGAISPLTRDHLKYKTEKGEFTYIIGTEERDESDIINEVHLFYNGNDLWMKGTDVAGSFSSITKVDVYMENKEKTTWSWIWPPLLTVSFALIIILTIGFAGSGFG
jgi:hypothetical protein